MCLKTICYIVQKGGRRNVQLGIRNTQFEAFHEEASTKTPSGTMTLSQDFHLISTTEVVTRCYPYIIAWKKFHAYIKMVYESLSEAHLAVLCIFLSFTYVGNIIIRGVLPVK
jgi:hypothetical protein